MHKFFVGQEFISDDKIIISDKETLHHIYGVLHFKVNDQLAVFDGKGNEYNCIIEVLSKNKIILSVKEKRFVGKMNKVKIAIACAIPKKSKFDDIIDKLIQLGVERIIPLKTERVVVKLDKDKEAARIRRWQKIALTAAEQSQRNDLAVIERAQLMKEVLEDSKDYGLKIIPTLEGERKTLKETLNQYKPQNILVFIGPEGDFTPEEVELAKKAGCIPVSLGKLVLRVETAAVAVASYIMLNENH